MPFELNKHSPQARGLVGLWTPLYKPGSILRDLSVFGRDADPGASPLTNTDAMFGLIKTLDGVDDYFEVIGYDGVLGAGAWTTSMWFKTTVGSVNALSNGVVSWGSTSTGTCTNVSVENGVIWNRTFGGRIVSFGSGFNDGEWHHFVLTTPGGNISVQRGFVDGVEISGSVSGDGAVSITAGSNPTTIGWATSRGSADQFNGSIAKVRLYDKEFNPSEVYQLYAPQTRWEPYAPIPRLFPVGVAAAVAGRTTRNTDSHPLGIHQAMAWRIKQP